MDWGPVVAGGVAGLGTGIVGSLVAPWVQLAVEQRRDQRRRRRELVDRWRQMVSRYHRPWYLDRPGDRDDEDELAVFRDLVDDPGFVSLRPYLSPAALTMLEAQSGTKTKPAVVRIGAKGLAVDQDLDLVAQEVDRLEKEWRLT